MKPSEACKLKQRFPTFREAMKAMINHKTAQALKIYPCGSCKGFHLSGRFIRRRRR